MRYSRDSNGTARARGASHSPSDDDIRPADCLHSLDHVRNEAALSPRSAALILRVWTNCPWRSRDINVTLLRWKKCPPPQKNAPPSRWQKHAPDLRVRCFQWFLPAPFLHIINPSLCSLTSHRHAAILRPALSGNYAPRWHVGCRPAAVGSDGVAVAASRAAEEHWI